VSITVWLTIARDVVIVGALGFIAWYLHHTGANSVKLADFQAVQKQLAANHQIEQQNAQAAAQAQVTHDQELLALNARIAGQHAPILLCQSPHPSPVPAAPATPESPHTASGTANTATRVDIRPAIDAFELKFESALADCRQTLASWPKGNESRQ
jgi:hypothetical protein